MIIKITPDKEKAKSMLRLIENREKFLPSINIKEFSTIAAEHYYEIIKELISILLMLDGKKTTGENAHKEMIEELAKYKEFNQWEIFLLDDLRIKRNKSYYEGKQIMPIYLETNKEKLKAIIRKLKSLVNRKLS